jgi:hypothetical protein
MKKQLLFLLLTFITTLVNAQVVVSNDYFKYLYIGIENSISISAKNVADANLVVTVSTGEIKRISAGKYSWKVCEQATGYSEIKIYNKSKIVDSVRFRLIPMPNPKILVTSQDGEIIFKGIKAWFGIRAEIDTTQVEGVRCTINRFIVTIQKNNGNLIRLENTGPGYDKHVIDAFTNLAIGEKVTLSDFLVTVGCELIIRKLNTTLSQVHSGKLYEFRH